MSTGDEILKAVKAEYMRRVEQQIIASPDEHAEAFALAAIAVVHRQMEALQHVPHIYLSTACHHGEHAYCQAKSGQMGTKAPAKCKFCIAKCLCTCHLEEEEIS